MENRVYYGEYSIRRWINLILTKSIVLPDYQRCFVWGEDKVEALVQTLKENRFVPPIVIGACINEDGSQQNYVIDGQQRLSSLLLAYIKKFPRKGAFPIEDSIVSDNDDTDDEEVETVGCDWTFRSVATGIMENEQTIRARCDSSQYTELNVSLQGIDLDTTYIGFCFLVPGCDDENKKIRYFTRTFHEVNKGGIALSQQESRRSLYFLKNDKKDFFEPRWSLSYTLMIKGKAVQRQTLDFVRYMALLFDYKKHNCDESKVACRRKKDLDAYYVDFVYSIVDGKTSDTFSKFSEVFPAANFVQDMNRLHAEIGKLSPPTEYDSIIDMDVYFMGLAYVVLFEKKRLKDEKIPALKEELLSLISSYRADSSHKKAPGALKNLRLRLNKSIAAFKKAV